MATLPETGERLTSEDPGRAIEDFPLGNIRFYGTENIIDITDGEETGIDTP